MAEHARYPVVIFSMYPSEKASVFSCWSQDNLFINVLLTEGCYLNKVMYINQTASLFLECQER